MPHYHERTRSPLSTMASCEAPTFFFFFFQAEDGIRDLTVTGVQTCALPISCITVMSGAFRLEPDMTVMQALSVGGGLTTRSEERRVGKESRSRRPQVPRKKQEIPGHDACQSG